MSIEYAIQSWDGTYAGDMEIPALTIKPDPALLKYIQENDFVIPIKITGTNTGYDNMLAMARCEPSQDVFGYRPNYQRITGNLILLPDLQWNSYPPELGVIHVLVQPSSVDTSTSPIDSVKNHKLFLVKILITLLLVGIVLKTF